MSCRRRDVPDLFLAAGLIPRSCAIIEQGSRSNCGRPSLKNCGPMLKKLQAFQYKERRRETETRIARTRENLDRLNDLSDELGRQLDRLKRQADAAERYKILKGELRDIESLIFWYRLQEQEKQPAKLTQQLHVRCNWINLRLLYPRMNEHGLMRRSGGKMRITCWTQRTLRTTDTQLLCLDLRQTSKPTNSKFANC